jgi:hypothetical protein
MKLLVIALKKEGAELVDKIEHKMLAAFKTSKDYKKHLPWARYSLMKLFQETAFENIDNLDVAIYYAKKAAKLANEGLGKYNDYIAMGLTTADVSIMYNVLTYWKKNYQKNKNKAYNFKILILVYPKTRAKTTYKAGKTGFINQNINKVDLESMEHRARFEYMRMFYFYLSKGKLLLSYDYKWTKSTMRELKYYNFETEQEQIDSILPVPETATPDVGGIYFKTINDYDGYITLYPGTIEGYAGNSGWHFYPPFVPGYLNSTVRRANINLTLKQKEPGVLIHEFFHFVESIYDVKPFHVMWAHYKTVWPSWYKGEGEWYYYSKIFKRVVLPKGISNLFLRKEKDTTSLENYNSSRAAFKKASKKKK